MILGGSILQLPAIKYAQKMGLEVWVVDMNPDAIGFKERDVQCLNISTTDTLRVMRAAKEHNINGIMTLASDVPMQTVAAVCHELGLPGISPQTALNATNKAEMRVCLQKHGVPIPDFYIVNSLEEFIEAAQKFKNEFIVKPVDNSGNRGVQLIKVGSNTITLRSAYEYSKQYSRDGRILLEEYMEGDEFSVETISVDGKCYVIQVTDKQTSGIPYFVELGHTQPSKYDVETVSRIAEVAKAGILALGINIGPSHAEIKLTPEGPKIVEIGARLGGGCITTHLVPLSTGVNMVEANIRIAIGEKPQLEKKIDKGAAIRFFHTKSGLFKAVYGVEEVSRISGIIEVGFFKHVGEIIPVMRNGLDRVGYVIAQCNTRDEAADLCEKAVKMIHFDIE